MKKYSLGTFALVLFVLIVQVGCAQTLSQNKPLQKSVAVVLKYTGKRGIPAQVELYSKNVFTGKVKRIKSTSASQFKEPVHVKFFDEQDKLIHEEYAQNPLKLNMESFEPEGGIQRNEVEKDNGYLNIRFGIDQSVKTIKMVCSISSRGEETVLSTLNISVQ